MGAAMTARWLPVFGLLALACSRNEDVREWRPTDHDNAETPAANQGAVSDGGQMGFMGVDEVALATWKSTCVECHGVIGRGDGPRGAEKKARNLTDPAWQATVTDEQLATSIKNGKGEMPANDVPDSTVKSLVRLVRLLNPESRAVPAQGASDAGAPDAAPRDAGADAGARTGARDAGRPKSVEAGTGP